MDYGISKEVKFDSRQDKWAKQREERGFDDTELWNLDKTIIKFLTPRLVAFREYTNATGNFKDDLDELIELFEELNGDIDNTFNGIKQDKAFELLAKLNGELWD